MEANETHVCKSFTWLDAQTKEMVCRGCGAPMSHEKMQVLIDAVRRAAIFDKQGVVVL